MRHWGDHGEEEITMATITTRLGRVTGLDDGKVQSFLGIRYAEPPTGGRRFLPPVPASPWEGTYDATAYPNRPMQARTEGTLGQVVEGKLDEDCLFLNIVTPSVEGSRRPVLFWIHGGGLVSGTANEYDGTVLAEQGDVVVVMINYRLGPFGFINLAGQGDEFAGSASNGFRDQILALAWVRDNIADYGGDPGNVTIFGESSGGDSVLSLLASPSADGLFHKIIALSARGVSAPPGDPTPRLAEKLGVEKAKLVDALRALSAEELQALGGGAGPSIDGTVITRSSNEAALDRGASGVPIVLGTNRNEGKLFTAGSSEAAAKNPGMFTEAGKRTAQGTLKGADPAEYIAGLQAGYPGDSPKEIYERIFTDMFRRPTIGIAERATAAGPGGWLFRFDLPASRKFRGDDVGAPHACALAFTFNTFANPDTHAFAFHDREDPVVRRLADLWSNALIAFARTGDPNGAGLPEWPRYSADDRRCIILDDSPRVESDPDAMHRKLWGDA